MALQSTKETRNVDGCLVHLLFKGVEERGEDNAYGNASFCEADVKVAARDRSLG